jgi:hypothetical protein
MTNDKPAMRLPEAFISTGLLGLDIVTEFRPSLRKETQAPAPRLAFSLKKKSAKMELESVAGLPVHLRTHLPMFERFRTRTPPPSET